MEAYIDEHYIDRVRTGLTATLERGDTTYTLRVRKVYPEVRDGKFRTDLVFQDGRPDNLRIGQTFYLNLELGKPETAIMVPRGTFFQSRAIPAPSPWPPAQKPWPMCAPSAR